MGDDAVSGNKTASEVIAQVQNAVPMRATSAARTRPTRLVYTSGHGNEDGSKNLSHDS